jgi:hypothetical protein
MHTGVDPPPRTSRTLGPKAETRSAPVQNRWPTTRRPSSRGSDDAFSVGSRAALLVGGRLIAQVRPAEVLTPDRLRGVYGVSVVVERLPQGQTVCAPDYGAGA